MKFCKDCKHIIPYENDLTLSACNLIVTRDQYFPVTGEEGKAFCSTARIIGQKCGPDGTLFEQRDE